MLCFFAVKVAPADAITTKITAKVSFIAKRSPKNNKAHNAANAGSRLIKILNVFAGRIFKAFISKVKGIALESNAKAVPNPNKTGFKLLIFSENSPNGTTNKAAKTIPVATAFPPSIIFEIRPPNNI